nr:hypothetical protein [Lachnospiraceae bacterium]
MKRFTRILAVMLALVLVFGSIPAQAASSSTTVTTQSALNEALTNGKYTKITIKTSDKLTFKIGDAKYSKIDLYVKSAKATIENNAVFKSITVDDAATYTEKAVGNTIKVADKKLTLNVAKGAKVKTLTLAKKNATDSVNIEGEVITLKVSSKTNLSLVNNGTISKLYTYKGGELDISGTPSAKTKIYVKKTGAAIKSVTPVKLYVYKAADITLETGAEGTTVNGKEDGAVISLKNGSGKKVTITEADGSKTSVSVGKSVTVGGSASETTPAPTATPVPTAVPTATPTPEPTATPTPTPEVKKLTVSQKATNVITISGDSVKSDIEKEDIKITYKESGISVPYSISIDKISYADGTVTVSYFSDFTANRVYYVKIGNDESNFTAVSDTLADVARIVCTTSTVPVAEYTSLDFKYYDGNDIELT